MSSIEATRERVRSELGQAEFDELPSVDDILCLRCEMEQALELLGNLRDLCAFEVCTLITALDHDESPLPTVARFDLVWQLQSMQHKTRVRLHAWLRGSEAGQDDFSAPSVTGLWPSAAYSERECFDMFGVHFEGHAGLNRILMPEAYEYHPLRKEFPHAGIEPDRLYNAWDKQRRQATAVTGETR